VKKASTFQLFAIIGLTALQIMSGRPGAAASIYTIVDPGLENALVSRPLGARLPAVITYGHQPGATEFAQLRSPRHH
jgi:hypothetical protein